MRRIALAFTVLGLVVATVPAAGNAATVVRTPFEIEVTDPATGERLTVRGGTYRRSDHGGCTAAGMLLVHGLSYGEYAWAFPLQPETYSVVHALAMAGYPSVAIDLPGYGASEKPASGYTLTVESYASMAAQIANALPFAKLGVVGHSAGTEITELMLGLGLADADVYIPTAYTHFPSDRIAVDFFTGDYQRAATSDYEYFGGDERGRTEYMYAPLPSPLVDPAVVAEDHRRAQPTPSGEIYSIGPQPSKLVMGTIAAPTLLVLAEHDLLFPIAFAEAELQLFAAATDKTLLAVPGAGHSFMLHRNAPDTMAAVTSWLDGRLPSC